MGKKLVRKQTGFTLIEVMIALAIFSAFLLGVYTTVGHNVTSSVLFKEDINLHNLAELKMNEVLLSKRKFTNATENDVDSGNFETPGFEKYKYEIKIVPTKFPDFSQIMGASEEDNNASPNPIQKLIFDKLKKNLEEIMWQVSVTITNTENNYGYELKSWVEKSNPKLDTNFNL